MCCEKHVGVVRLKLSEGNSAQQEGREVLAAGEGSGGAVEVVDVGDLEVLPPGVA